MRKDLTNLTFGRLKVIKNVGTNKHGFTLWECLCECGNTVNVISRNLISGHTKSCGCYSYECKKDKMLYVGNDETKVLKRIKKEVKKGLKENENQNKTN